MVVKSDGSREPFDKGKLQVKLQLACNKRPISTAQIEEITDRIEARLRRMDPRRARLGVERGRPVSSEGGKAYKRRKGRPVDGDTLDEVDRLIAAPEIGERLGLRNRAMLELLYASGLRVSELVELRLDQLNLRVGVVRIVGKGDKERLAPLSDRARGTLQRYLDEVRPGLAARSRAEHQNHLYLSRTGRPLDRARCVRHA